ncbi:MAG: hypothetical protein R2787_08550 [Saprospiraceae bacterium]
MDEYDFVLIDMANPFPVLHIPDSETVARHCPIGLTPKVNKRRIPSPDCFALRSGEEGLSVNWHEKLDTVTHFLLIGIQYNRNSDFLNPHMFRIYTLPMEWLRNLGGIKEIKHAPVYNGDPSPVGHPNNPWHAEIYFTDMENNQDVRLWLSEYCQSNFDTSYQPYPGPDLDECIADLRARNDQTVYHRVENWGIS